METKEIVFFQTMSGKHTIRQGDQEILIDLSKMKLDQKCIRGIIFKLLNY